jgi:hypothetical protein
MMWKKKKKVFHVCHNSKKQVIAVELMNTASFQNKKKSAGL